MRLFVRSADLLFITIVFNGAADYGEHIILVFNESKWLCYMLYRKELISLNYEMMDLFCERIKP